MFLMFSDKLFIEPEIEWNGDQIVSVHDMPLL